jgi:ATPase subunit of ABC transporter with duplicated ATPase domains
MCRQEADEGTITRSRALHIAYLTQHDDFSEDPFQAVFKFKERWHEGPAASGRGDHKVDAVRALRFLRGDVEMFAIPVIAEQ